MQEQRPSGQMIVSLASLRGLAAIAVLGHHFAPLLGGVRVFNRGFLGVDLFFMLSGFILTKVYKEAVHFRSFFVARIARTYPLHLLMLIVLLPSLGRTKEFSAMSLLCNLTMTQVVCGGPHSWNVVSWSLSAEWISYLLFPLLLEPVLRCPRWIAGLLIVGCMAALIAVSPITKYDVYGMGALGRSLPEFLLGMILFRAYRKRWLAHWTCFLGAIVALLSALLTQAPDIVILSAFAVIILASPYAKIMEHRILRFLGEVSYSLYMSHLLVGIAVVTAMIAVGIKNTLEIAAVALAASISSAFFLYRYVEMPARSAIRNWMSARAPE